MTLLDSDEEDLEEVKRTELTSESEISNAILCILDSDFEDDFEGGDNNKNKKSRKYLSIKVIYPM